MPIDNPYDCPYSEHGCTDAAATSLTMLLAEAADLKVVEYEPLWEYARLVVVLGHPVDRAITYLKDCNGSPEHAKGRLLLRAAERALRDAGDIEEGES